jgi:putative acetyltransferase
MAPAPAMRIRRIEVRDAEAVARAMATPIALSGTLQLPYPSASTWERRIGDLSKDDYMLVAEIDGDVVGNAGLHPAGGSPRRRHAAAIGMSVRDDCQRRGVGSALLGAIIDLAENWIGYTRLELTVYVDNAAALSLYRKFGFAVEGTLRDYALRDGSFVDAYAMARFAQPRPRSGGVAATTRDGES